MKTKAIVFSAFVLFLLLIALSIGVIDQGNVGVRKSFGKVSAEPVQPGFFLAVFSHVKEFSTKESSINLDDLTPKAKDNLSLKDLDVTIYFRTEASKVPGLEVKYVGQSSYSKVEDVSFPAYRLVENLARGAIYSSVGDKYDSLTIHSKRAELEGDIKGSLQRELDDNDPNTFYITRVVVRQVLTDPAIENSIRLKATEESKLRAKMIQVEVERKNVEIRELENQGLTANVLRNKELDVLRIAAEKGSVFVVPQGSTPIINLK